MPILGRVRVLGLGFSMTPPNSLDGSVGGLANSGTKPSPSRVSGTCAIRPESFPWSISVGWRVGAEDESCALTREEVPGGGGQTW